MLLVLAVAVVVLVAAGWCFFNGLPLPVTAADHAAIVTARDFEPWVEGLSAKEGSESLGKRMTFFLGRGIDAHYRFEKLRGAGTPFGLICNITSRESDERAQATFEALGSASRIMLDGPVAFLAGGMGGQPAERLANAEHDEVLRWGDASSYSAYRTEKVTMATYVARRGRQVFALTLVGPHLDESILAKILRPRLEALGRD